VLSAPRSRRARRSPRGQFPLGRGAVAASIVAALSYVAIGPRPALADSSAHWPPGVTLLALQSGTQLADLASQPDAIGMQLASDEAALVQVQGQVDTLAARLRQQAVNAYVDGTPANPPFQGGGYSSVLQREYLATVTNNEQDALRRLDQARSALRAEQARLEADEQAGQSLVAQALAPGAIAASAGPDQSTGSLAINGPPDFAVALLKTLGAPVTMQNIAAIVAWCQREGGGWGNVARFNPLNTSMRMPGSHAINGDGVQSYTSWSQGLTATAATLNGGSYRGILAALDAGNSVAAVERAVASSPWGTHF